MGFKVSLSDRMSRLFLTLICSLFCIFFLHSIDSLRDLSHHRNLQDLDLSHNAIEALEGLSALKCLRTLKMNNNKIRRIEGLDGKGGRAGSRNRNNMLFPQDAAHVSPAVYRTVSSICSHNRKYGKPNQKTSMNTGAVG